MQNREWEKDYETLLANSLLKGEFNGKSAGSEKRVYPRFSITTGEVWVKVEQSFEVIDISKSGVSFFSSLPFEGGNQIGLTLGKAFLVEVTVVQCAMVERDPTFLEAMYRVSCRFEDEYTGTRALVMLKEMDDLEVGFSPRPF